MTYEITYIYQLCAYDEFGKLDHILYHFDNIDDAKATKIAMDHCSIKNNKKYWIAYNKCLAIKVDDKYFLLKEELPVEVRTKL